MAPPHTSKSDAQGPRVTPAVGSPAPALALPADDGSTFDLAAADGYVVVYFYPKDDTPGCTTEACDFRDNFARFSAAGCTVVGVSPDPAKRHLRFRDKYELPFTLVSDEEKSTIAAWGAWGLKKFMGRESMGVIRSTYLVAPDGSIAGAWPKVRVKGHVDDVLAQLNAHMDAQAGAGEA